MIDLLLWIGRVSGFVGVVLFVVAVLLRLTGQWHIGGMSVGTLLQGAVATMIVAVLAYTAMMAEQPRK